jgi:hypothetical protein
MPNKYTNEPRIHPASDDKGHNIKYQVRISPDWIYQLDIIVKSKRFPYVNKGQVIRDALYRHMIWLEEFGTPDGSVLQKIQSMVDILEEAKIQQGFEKVLENLQDRVAYFTNKGARTEAVKYVLRVLGYIDDMPDGHWKDSFRAEIRERYSGLLQCTPRANLGAQSCISENDIGD